MTDTDRTSKERLDWRALCLKLRDAVQAEGQAMQWGAGVKRARRELSAVWNEIEEAEKFPVETTERSCACIPIAPRPWKYCADCGGRIPVEPTGPESLVGALQDRVHKEIGVTRAAHAVKATSPRDTCGKCSFDIQNHEPGELQRCLAENGEPEHG